MTDRQDNRADDPIQRRAEQYPPEAVAEVLVDALELINVVKGYYRDQLSPTELARLSEAYQALGNVEDSVRWRRKRQQRDNDD